MGSWLGILMTFALAASALWVMVGPRESGTQLAEDEYPEDQLTGEEAEGAPVSEAITH